MSLATKKDLEAFIAGACKDLEGTREDWESDSPRCGDSSAEYRKGYIDACKDARSLLGIAVKTYRIDVS